MIYDKLKYPIVLVIVLISLFMGYQLVHLGYDYDFEAFFPRNHKSTEFFKEYRTQFESDNDYILVGIQNDEGVFQESFIAKLDSLTRQLEKLDNVVEVMSPTNVVEFRRYAYHPALVELPYLHVGSPDKWKEDSIKIFSTPELVNTFFSTHSSSVAVLIKHTQLLDNPGCAKLSREVRELVQVYDFNEAHFAGRSEGQTIYIDIVQNETTVFVGASAILIIVFLLISYRSFWGVWMPLSIVGLVVLWTMGTMVLTGKKIDLMTNIVPTMLMVIGISAVVHLLTHFLSLRRQGQGRLESLTHSVKEIGFATFLTTLTTMIGFLTLLGSSVQPVVDLGIYGSIGLVFSFVLTYTWFPSVLLLHPPVYSDREIKYRALWQKVLMAINDFVAKRYKALVVLSLIATMAGLSGVMMIRKDNYILEGLKYNHPQRQDFRYFKNNFSGARPFEMKLWLTDTNISFFDKEVLNQVELLHNYLENEYGVGSLITPARLLKTANKINHQGKEEFFVIPVKDAELRKLEKEIYRYSKQGQTNLYLDRNHYEARVVGKIPDWGSYRMRRLNKSLDNFFKTKMDTKLFHYELTGTATLMDINTNYVASNVIEGLVVAIAIIGLIVGWLFRSVKMALISVLPNVFPLVVAGGIMGFFGIDFNLSTSIIFIIAFGIAVDDSIHFLSRLRTELARTEGDIHESLKATFSSTGKAIIVTTLILSGGFLTLCLSDFLGTFYIGLLISITLLVALLCDLFLLPAVILLFWKK